MCLIMSASIPGDNMGDNTPNTGNGKSIKPGELAAGLLNRSSDPILDLFAGLENKQSKLEEEIRKVKEEQQEGFAALNTALNALAKLMGQLANNNKPPKKETPVPVPGPGKPEGVTDTIIKWLVEDPTLKTADLVKRLKKEHNHEARTSTVQTTRNTACRTIKEMKKAGWQSPKA
jgi:hypothetical protein